VDKLKLLARLGRSRVNTCHSLLPLVSDRFVAAGGGRCVLGLQSIAQVSGAYGHAEAQTIVENCGNTLILRCSPSERGGTARFASSLIGEREITREHVTVNDGGGFFSRGHGSTSKSLQYVTESAALPSQIEQLPDLQGYLKFASQPEWRRVRLTARHESSVWQQERRGVNLKSTTNNT
jgi:type IV secretory pathway TraG/TraD family ATPase VirD4